MVNTLKQVYKTIYSNTHPFAFVYCQRQKIRSMTAITTKSYAMASPIRSQVPGPGSQVLVAPSYMLFKRYEYLTLYEIISGIFKVLGLFPAKQL